MTQKLISKNWQDIELPFLADRPLATLADLDRLDPDRGWAMISLKIPSYGFRGRTETVMLLTLLLDYEGHRYDTQSAWDALTMSGTIARLTDLIDQHLVPKGRRA